MTMISHRPKTVALFAVIAASTAHAKRPQADDSLLAGVWISRDCEAASPAAPLSTRRVFHFGHSTWKVEVTFYGGAACVGPLFGIGVEGSYITQAAPDAAAAVLFGTFYYAQKTAWALSTEGAKRLAVSHCGAREWQAGMTQDIASTGCLAFAPISPACLQEFDLVAINGEELRFGVRRPEMCREDGRPMSLSPFPLVRIPAR